MQRRAGEMETDPIWGGPMKFGFIYRIARRNDYPNFRAPPDWPYLFQRWQCTKGGMVE